MDLPDDVANALARFAEKAFRARGGGTREFDKIWKYWKRRKLGFVLRGPLNLKFLAGARLPGVPEDKVVVRLPRGTKFDTDLSRFGIGEVIDGKVNGREVQLRFEPGFRPDGKLRMARLILKN